MILIMMDESCGVESLFPLTAKCDVFSLMGGYPPEGPVKSRKAAISMAMRFGWGDGGVPPPVEA